jgi:peptide deformylase
MQILTYPHPFLSRVCHHSFTVSLDDINQMFFLIRERNALGLAAPQVGIDARFFVTAWGDVFVDPRIVNGAHPVRIMEQCLSLPGETYEVRRLGKIKLATGQIFKGIHAIVIQHEINHLNGILISDPQ